MNPERLSRIGSSIIAGCLIASCSAKQSETQMQATDSSRHAIIRT